MGCFNKSNELGKVPKQGPLEEDWWAPAHLKDSSGVRSAQQEMEGVGWRGPNRKSLRQNLLAATRPRGLLRAPPAHSGWMPGSVPASSAVPTCQPSQDDQRGQDASAAARISHAPPHLGKQSGQVTACLHPEAHGDPPSSCVSLER